MIPIKVIPLTQVLVYDFVINILGNLGFWYGIVLKDIFKYSFQMEFDYELDKNQFIFFNYFAFGQIISSLIWTYLLRFMSEKNAILVCLVAQGLIYFLKAQFADSLGIFYFCRVLQGLFDVLNSVGKSFTFEFCDVDYLQICFTIKGLVALVMGNVIPPIGVKLYHKYTDRDFAACCNILGVFSLIISVVFYVCFYLLPYSDNT